MTLLIDNYDSFSYNIYQLAGSMDSDIRVVRNDMVTAAEVEKMMPDRIILSPGPGYPKDAGICEEVIRTMKGKVPILGICLGHQAICEVFGAEIVRAKKLMHGKKSMVYINEKCPIFSKLPVYIEAARYHSLIAEKETMPECLEVTAEVDDGEVMAVKHKDYDIYGLQFHPESILTPLGSRIMQNFVRI